MIIIDDLKVDNLKVDFKLWFETMFKSRISNTKIKFISSRFHQDQIKALIKKNK